MDITWPDTRGDWKAWSEELQFAEVTVLPVHRHEQDEQAECNADLLDRLAAWRIAYSEAMGEDFYDTFDQTLYDQDNPPEGYPYWPR